MQKYAYRIRKIQAEMGIKPTDFTMDILDKNTVMRIEMEYEAQVQQNQELGKFEESETENADLNYEEIMTGSNSANKMPDPRESIFATHYSRTDKSCPSPTVRPLARIVKRATYYNNSCYLGPSKPEEPYRVQVYKHIINYDNQCYTSLGALDQEETFAA